MRLDECRQVKKTLAEHLGINLTIADASQKFLAGLKDVVDPETKRKLIGNTFIDIFEEEAVKIEKAAENTPNAGKVEWFLQGTLYPVSVCALLRQVDAHVSAGRYRVHFLQGPIGHDQGIPE